MVRPILLDLHQIHAVQTIVNGILLTEKGSRSIEMFIFKTQMHGRRMMTGKAIIIKVIAISEIVGSGNQSHGFRIRVNGHVRQVPIDYNNKKIFLYITVFLFSIISQMV
jgi:hypothetical protein